MPALSSKTLLAAALAASIVLPSAVFAQSSLTIAYGDPMWTGGKLPAGQQCSLQGGHGTTPPLTITGVPDGTTAITESFNDEGYEAMNHGGHGVLGFAVTPAGGSVSLPSAPG